MSIGALDAMSAYGRVAGLGGNSKTDPIKTGGSAGGFGAMVEDMVTGTADSCARPRRPRPSRSPARAT